MSPIPTVDASTGAMTKFGYGPYGAAAPAPAVFGYTGQRVDPEAGGLYYYRNRHYFPAWGRFLQPDPLGYDAGLNLYAYVLNDPLNALDPDGLKALQAIDWGLTIGSFCPSVCGSAFSGLQSVLYTIQGQYTQAAISGTAAVAGLVSSAGAVKLAALGISSAAAIKTVAGVSQAAGTTATRLALPNARQINYSWGALNSYKNTQMTALEHINYRHAFDSGFTGVSRFSQGTTARDIRSFVELGSRYGKVTAQGRNGFKLEYNLGRAIGTSDTGAVATGIRAYIRDG